MADFKSYIIESLREGIPPQRGVEKYSVGNEELIEGIKKYHLSQISQVGKIRFISGSWGGGKTHLFRLIRDVAFQENCAVSNTQLSIDSAPLNKFEEVFYSIIRNIYTPSYYQEVLDTDISPIGKMFEESLKKLSNFQQGIEELINEEHFFNASQILMRNTGIDIDFKKMVQHYWKTFLPGVLDNSIAEQLRGEILQWFSGEGTIGTYRKKFGINKMISRANAKLMLQSLAEFVKLAGYRGLVVLFDEAEQSYSIMRKSALKDAHNNLLSLINNIESTSGLFLIYATTPDFYTDPKHGIVIYGALSTRIGKPEDTPPKALSKIWNLDAVSPELKDYQEAAKKIRSIYLYEYPDAKDKVDSEKETVTFVKDLYAQHPPFSAVRFWRIMVSSLISRYDSQIEGGKPSVEKVYKDVMERLKES